MATINESPLLSGFERERAALDVVLASDTFGKAVRLAALLEYICVRHFRGAGDSIKEYSIATDVFGRPSDFDQSTDAIVRVEMFRLRKKLRAFYDGEGADQPIEIVIHPGRYSPEFLPRPGPDSSRPGPSTPAPHSLNRPRHIPLWMKIAGAIALAALIAAAIVGLVRKTAGATIALGPAIPPAALSNNSVRILCGSSQPPFRDRNGDDWSADRYFTGGVPADAPAPLLYRSLDSRLFLSSRRGDFSYDIPLKPGVYELRLYFADTSFTPGIAMDGGESTRYFNVSMNGAPVFRQFDVIADSGPSTADIKVFKDVHPAPDGFLHLRFSHEVSEPLLNAIEIRPGTLHRLRPIRIVAQDVRYVDRSGAVWSPDNYFQYGRLIARNGIVAGTPDPEIYSWERYGNFSYAIPVAQGSYTVSLHFAESFFGSHGPGDAGAGMRLFDVFLNGTALLRNFDMFAEAGFRHALVKTFHGVQPNPQGKLLFSFVPSKNYASLSAIEAIDESE